MHWDQAATLVDQQRVLVEELIRSEMSSARQVDDRVRLVRMLLSLIANEVDTSDEEEEVMDALSSMVSSTDVEEREEQPTPVVSPRPPPMSDIFNAVMGPELAYEEGNTYFTLPASWASTDNLQQWEHHQRTEIDLLELRVRTELHAASQRVATSRSFLEHRQLQLFDSVHHLRSSIELARTTFMHEMYEASRQANTKRRQFATKRPHVNRLL